MIRIADPLAIGPALGQVRLLLGIGRRELSRQIAETTGRKAATTYTQMWNWENGHHTPDLPSLVLFAGALGYDLALIPRENT